MTEHCSVLLHLEQIKMKGSARFLQDHWKEAHKQELQWEREESICVPLDLAMRVPRMGVNRLELVRALQEQKEI